MARLLKVQWWASQNPSTRRAIPAGISWHWGVGTLRVAHVRRGIGVPFRAKKNGREGQDESIPVTQKRLIYGNIWLTFVVNV